MIGKQMDCFRNTDGTCWHYVYIYTVFTYIYIVVMFTDTTYRSQYRHFFHCNLVPWAGTLGRHCRHVSPRILSKGYPPKSLYYDLRYPKC